MYPINLDIKGKKICVLGGGHVALRKIRTLLAEGAEVHLIAPEAHEDLKGMADAGQLIWHKTVYQPGMLAGKGYLLVFCATDSCHVNEAAAAEARRAGALVNSIITPEDCDSQVPSRVCRGDLMLTVSTGGSSPAFSRLIRQDLERNYSEVWGQWLKIQAGLRMELKAKVTVSKQREALWHSLMSERLIDLIKLGKLDQAEEELRNAINSFRP